MKEPITGRDLFVISTLCTGFGALAAWGLFYRWGSAPPSKAIDWSAWIQAIGTLIAVAVAIYVPHRIAGNEDRRKRRLLTCLMEHAALPTIVLATSMVRRSEDTGNIEVLVERVQAQIKALAAFPMEHAADDQLLRAKLNVEQTCHHVLELVRDHNHPENGFGEGTPDLSVAASNYRKSLAEFIRLPEDDPVFHATL